MNPAACYIIGSLRPWRYGYLRREYTRSLIDGHGEYYFGAIHGLRVIEGQSLWLQFMMMEEHAGAGFLAPIEAFCHAVPAESRKAGERVDMTYVQPWDSFSSSFSVHQLEFHRHMRALILPDRRPATYWCSLDFAESSLAEDTTQHKHLHLFLMADGSIGAFPNNRVLWDDPAFFVKTTEAKPDFTSLWGEFRAEGTT